MPGRYYITKQVGKDPVSELFLALDATDKSGKGTEFHLQRFRGEFCSKEAFVAALEAEATVELGLNQENILRLLDFGMWEGLSFLVYEKHVSLSLTEALAITRAAGKAIDHLVVAGIALQLLDALVYAHAVGDGKKHTAFQSGFSPDSVTFSGDGRVKVRGFARMASGAGARPSFLDMALGRMPYLSPAIWAGHRASPGTDLYSLGALLWEMLVGQPLSKGGGSSEGAPPVFSLRPDVPRELDNFVARLLAAEEDQAFASAAEAKVALDKALFTLNAKVGKKDLSAWHKKLRKLDPKAGLKEEHEGTSGERKVIAEVVANRKLQVFDTKASAKEVEPVVAAMATPVTKEEAAPAFNAWDKNVTFREVPDTEPEEQLAKNAKKKKVIRMIAAGLTVLAAVCGVGLFFFYSDGLLLNAQPEIPDTKSAVPRELLAVFAYQSNGSVVVQGVRNEHAKSFAHGCGEVGRPCICDYLVAPDDTDASSSQEGVYSAKYNLVQCPESHGAEKFVRISSKEENAKTSNSVLIRSSLTWKHVLGPDLVKARVRWVSQFSCDRTFVEGDGVEGAKFSCPPSQKLSLLVGLFHYYSFRSEEEGEKGEAIPVSTDSVCGNAAISPYRCRDGGKQVLFGLYRKEEPPFTMPISLTRAPVGEELISVYGFAAEPDASGICPAGLVKVRQWTSTPASIAGTTFVNDIGQLNDRVLESLEPKAFSLTRQKNRSPCDGKGDCSFATFEDPVVAQATSYTQGLEACVLPPYFLTAADSNEEKLPGAVKEKSFEATVRIKSVIPAFEARVNGKKVEVKNNAILVPVNEELNIEVYKQGFMTQRFTVPPREKTSEPYELEAASVPVVLGNVDLASFPPSIATFYLGGDRIFSGPTPVNEKLPVGKYRVKLVDKIGTENEITVTVVEGKTVSVDHLMKKKD